MVKPSKSASRGVSEMRNLCCKSAIFRDVFPLSTGTSSFSPPRENGNVKADASLHYRFFTCKEGAYASRTACSERAILLIAVRTQCE